MEDKMKKLLLSLVLLMFLVGNAFAAELVQRSQGQRIYIPCYHTLTYFPGGQQHLTTKIRVYNYDGNARIDYIKYYGVDQVSGALLPAVNLVEDFDLGPWSSWVWDTRDFWGGFPTEEHQYSTRAIPFFVIKWASTNGNRIRAPSFGGSLTIWVNYDIKAVVVSEARILEELSYWH
jgi:hypothetical protein